MRKLRVLFILAALAVMMLPCALMPVLPSTIGAENRLPAEWPSLFREGRLNLSFPTQYESWLQDHISHRSICISLFSRMMQAIGTSSEPQVLLGQDGWLYFRETLNDYTCEAPLSDDGIARLALLLETADDGLRRSGSSLILAIAPNKASIYPQFMNPAYPRGEISSGNADRLRRTVHVPWVPLFTLLSERSDEGVYFRKDTHWNGLGARIAANAILKEIQSQTGVDLSLPDTHADYLVRTDWPADLARMLNPYSSAVEPQQYYADSGAFTYQGRFRSAEDLTIRTAGGAADLKLLVLRDSFSNQLITDISSAVREVTYLRAMPLPLNESEGFDAVLLEMAERRLPELLEAPPVMYAPKAMTPQGLDAARSVEIHLQSEQTGSGLRIYGSLSQPPCKVEELSVGLVTDHGETWYRAFPVSGLPDDGNGGFSVLLDTVPDCDRILVYMRGESESVKAEASFSNPKG